jgi:hypothetical protein
LNVPEAVGVPLIVIVFEAKLADTPEGRPEATPIPVAPVVECVIAVNPVLMHNVGVDDAAPAESAGFTVKDAVFPAVADAQPIEAIVIVVLPAFTNPPTEKVPELLAKLIVAV